MSRRTRFAAAATVTTLGGQVRLPVGVSGEAPRPRNRPGTRPWGGAERLLRFP
jgi:hypothetical protein